MDPRLEERYIVVKIKDLPQSVYMNIESYLANMKIRKIDCVVIEEDWPEYDPTVNLLWERINGI